MICCKVTNTFSTVSIYKREELTQVILKLLQAWKEPLSHFNQHIEHHQELPDDSLSKAKQISNMVHELKTGVEKVTEKARFFYIAFIYISYVAWVTSRREQYLHPLGLGSSYSTKCRTLLMIQLYFCQRM